MFSLYMPIGCGGSAQGYARKRQNFPRVPDQEIRFHAYGDRLS
jgi:hypothetical protein